MQFLLDLDFWHSVEEARTRLFPTQSRFICIPKKDRKHHTFWRRKFGPLYLFQYVWFWPPFYFNLFLLHSFLVRPRWDSNKSTRKSSPFFELSRIIAYNINIDLVLLWCKFFLVLLPRFWIVLVLLTRSPKIFLHFLPRSWKILENLANLAKNKCQDLGKKCQKSKKFFGKKTKSPNTEWPSNNFHVFLELDFLTNKFQILIYIVLSNSKALKTSRPVNGNARQQLSEFNFLQFI